MTAGPVKSERETIYFVIGAVYSAIIYLIAIISIVGIGIALAVLAVVLFMNAMMLGSIRGNGIRISHHQFGDVYARVEELSSKMGLKKTPDVFVIQSEGALNAFATRFFGRNMVVLYSEVFELARQQGAAELDFIIAHELSHIKRRHVWKNILLMPAQLLPFLSQAYSRSCEYTCDREAAYMTDDGAAAKRALTILGAGKLMAREVNEEAYLEQIRSESNGAVWMSEILSTHPILPKRIQSVGRFMNDVSTPLYRPNYGKIAVGAGLLFGGLFGAYISVLPAITVGTTVFASLLPESDWEETGWEESGGLIEAASYGDIRTMEDLIAAGEDLEATDPGGSTALMNAVYAGQNDAAQLLLKEGADPNAADDYSYPIIIAVANENNDLAALLYGYGADPTAEDTEGDSAYSWLNVSTEEEFEEALGIANSN
ncbi:M48 family metallopeptidase [Jeotgalibacillus proteolyticus]|uniref:M48 family metallopeptidase n=1 Tax=Jeotgalibacillus proteolyticus TaxID=2082395 RepID=UPI003CEA4F18